MAVTVDDVTVIIKDYPVKKQKISADSTKNIVQDDLSDTSSNSSTELEEKSVNNNT